MDVRFTEEQKLLRESARALLERECSMQLVRAMIDDERGYTDALWAKAVELGWTGLACGAEYGGAGLGLVETAVLMEETGRALMPGPLLSTVAIGTASISLGGSDAQKAELLPKIADGSLRVALAQLEDTASWGPEGIEAVAKKSSGGYVLTGTKRFIADGASADMLIVPALVDGAHTLLLVDPATPHVSMESTSYTDVTRRMATAHFDNVDLAADAVLGVLGQGWQLLERILDRAKVALSAEMCGGMSSALDLSVEYAKTREQFDSPIGKFQSIQHKCADMFVLLESSRSAAYYAAWAIDNDEADAHRSACLAKAYCSDAFSKVTSECIQIHGGFGFTWESDCHLYYKRAKAGALTFGDAAFNREEAVRELLD
jgi:alkylation response protein AidB-like acyl-CoA dehydrogenase